MRRLSFAWSLLVFLPVALSLGWPVALEAFDYAVGADLSFLKQAEDRGAVFKDAGHPKAGLQILKDHGYNWIRLRLFHSPTQLPNNLSYTLSLAKEARQLGFNFLLDFHYSDTWADPAKQYPPKAWEGKSHAELVEAVFAYTRDTIRAFGEAGVMPQMVQVGNEISHGMLWPDGKLPEHWDNFAELVKAGIRGVEAGRAIGPRPQIMIHIDKGGDRNATKYFFDKLNSYGVSYDIIGQSYYPWWQGTLRDLRENLRFMASEYQKDIMVVEAAYNWRPAEYRDKPGPYAESPAGQKEFLEEVNQAVLSTPNGRGKGVFWWEPALAGGRNSRGMFDNAGNALPVLTLFDPSKGPLKVSNNPNYFAEPGGSPVILCGSQTWNTLQDWGTGGSVRPLDFDAFVRFLKAHGHNFTLLWYTELPKFHGLPTTENEPPDFTVSPFPWMRTGPGLATAGGLKFDLTKFDQAYFDRLRARVETLYRAGIYAGVYLFTAEFLLRFRSATDGYPFSGPNNVNGVDDGYRGGPAESGLGSVTMTSTNAITAFQDAYVRKAIDTLNGLPNVLWIVSEEAPMQSLWWNDHLIALVRAYEREKPYQHPIGYAAPEKPPDSIVYNSDADWVAPAAKISPEKSCGTGNPTCKVNINDSDHSYFGMWNDTPQVNRNYAWENFMTGNQVLFMDPYLVYYPRQNRNLCPSPANGIGSQPDPRWENFRNNLGYLLHYSRKVNLAEILPRGSLCSTGFCLAQTPAIGAEYLVYAPAGGPFTLDLSAMPSSRNLAVEWFNPATGETMTEHPIPAGSSAQSFTPPFTGDAVLYIVDTAGHK